MQRAKVENVSLSYHWQTIQTPLGSLVAKWNSNANLQGLWFLGQKYFPKETLTKKALTELSAPSTTLLREMNTLSQALAAYFKGDLNGWTQLSTLRLDPQGSEFQKRVWKLLLQIPYSETTTYGEIAKTIASQQGKTRFSAQAVGGAVGRNPISIIIPCHRVVGAKGQLTGYAGGIDKKQQLLTLERNSHN